MQVQVMVEPGADPHTYEPKPQQMVAISKAKLYFAIGIDFEAAKLQKIVTANPHLKSFTRIRGCQKIPMTDLHHHETNRPAEGLLDPHIWLSPPLVKLQAQTILKALQEIDPQNSSVYERTIKHF